MWGCSSPIKRRHITFHSFGVGSHSRVEYTVDNFFNSCYNNRVVLKFVLNVLNRSG
jgi:hypothetical protein